MEKSRAIELLEHLAWDRDIERNPYGDALNMAIDALKAQHSNEGTTSDLISRRAVIDAVEKNACNTQRIMDAVNNLPPAQPESKEGHWIKHETPDGDVQYECSRCGVLWEFNDGTPEDNEAYFCPKCGARMKGEPNETD